MAGASLLTLLDDIATVLDDVAVLTKRAATKTAGVLGDDLALNAEQVSGVRAEREIPVVWAVAKGSFLNKLILVPAALTISVLMPWLITPLLMLGGLYLCYEGVEKLLHKYLHNAADDAAHHAKLTNALLDPDADLVELEKTKIKGAIRTDFILSAEIIVIALGTVQEAGFLTQVLVVSSIALAMTLIVYSLVAGIVKLDDAGLFLMKKQGAGTWRALQRKIGGQILWLAPYLMKTLSIVGTLAMFLVGGGILVHGIPAAAHFGHEIGSLAADLPLGVVMHFLAPLLFNAIIGILAGALTLAVILGGTRVVVQVRS